MTTENQVAEPSTGAKALLTPSRVALYCAAMVAGHFVYQWLKTDPQWSVAVDRSYGTVFALIGVVILMACGRRSNV